MEGGPRGGGGGQGPGVKASSLSESLCQEPISPGTLLRANSPVAALEVSPLGFPFKMELDTQAAKTAMLTAYACRAFGIHLSCL